MSKTQVLLVVLGVVIGVVVTTLFVGSGARAQAGFSACGYLTIPGNGGSRRGHGRAGRVSVTRRRLDPSPYPEALRREVW